MIRFHDLNDYFELDLATQEGRESPATGDAYMKLKIVSAGFVGHNDLWVDARLLRKFCSDILKLATKRQVSARIEGMSPNAAPLSPRFRAPVQRPPEKANSYQTDEAKLSLALRAQ